MKLETLSNIISNLWHENDVDEIRVQLRLNKSQFRHDVITYDVALVCRDISISDEDDRKHIINDTLLTGVTRLVKSKYGIKYDPQIIDVRISPSNIDHRVMDVDATLGTLGGTLII